MVLVVKGETLVVPKFHSSVKCTMQLINITQIGYPTLPLACVLSVHNGVTTWKVLKKISTSR